MLLWCVFDSVLCCLCCVLVVDDYCDVVDVLCLLFEVCGFECWVVDDLFVVCDVVCDW